jgi:hypothetical protein
MELRQLSPPHDSPAGSITIGQLRPMEGAVLVIHPHPFGLWVCPAHPRGATTCAVAPPMVVMPAAVGLESVPSGVLVGTGAHVVSAGIRIG